MATYRLVWSGDGALDLSQVLDTRGRPIVLSPQTRMVSVSEATLKNPYVQRYLGPTLQAELLDGPKPVVPPPVPVSKPAPPPPPPPPKVEPVVATPPPVAPAEVMTKETLAETPSSAEPPSPSTTPSPDADTGTEPKGGFFKGRKGRR